MRKLSKLLSAGLSLTLCAALVVPSFAAASFADLQDAVNSDRGTQFTHTAEDGTQSTRWGYGANIGADGNAKYELEAWDEGGARKVELNANVEYDKAGDDHDRVGGIWVWKQNVDIELNGHDIDMNPGKTLDAATGEFKDAAGNTAAEDDLNKGTVFQVQNGKTLTITDSTAKVAETVVEDGETKTVETYVAGQGTGEIKGGNASGGNEAVREGGVGAVYVKDDSSFHMYGGSISGNRSDKPTLCAENPTNGGANSTLNVSLTGVTVENNRTEEGTVYFTAKSGTVNTTIDGCVLKDNVAGGDIVDIGVHNNANGLTAEVKNTTVKDNVADKDSKNPHDHGAVAVWQDSGKTLSITFSGCTIQNNKGGSAGIYYWNQNGEQTLNISDSTVCGNGANSAKEQVKLEFGEENDMDALHTDAYWDAIEGVVVKKPTYTETGLIRYTCQCCGEYVEAEIPALTDHVEIDDPEVPLAGLFTRGDAIGYLWEQAGSPEAELSTFPDVPKDHQWAVAIGWAEDMGIALPDLEGNFRPDDLVLRSVEGLEASPEGELQEFLNRYAAYAGIELAEDELFIELAGAWDDVIMGEEAQEIFDGFSVQLEAALAQAA